MRVTKTIREYIEKEVAIRIAPKYAVEEAEAKRQRTALQNFFDTCFDDAMAAFNKSFDANFAKVADFAEDERTDKNSALTMYTNRMASIKDRFNEDSVHQWERRRNAEIKKLVDEIIVNLELGGTKAELMDMLNKIGAGE